MLSIDKKSIEFGGFVPINPSRYQQRTSGKYSPKLNYLNSTQLPVNERYRRLIPYMTFYLANDFSSPQNDAFISKAQLQKVAVVPQNGKLLPNQYSEIPRYQGNRLSQFNIASAFPNKIIQDYLPELQQNNVKYLQTQVPVKFNNIQSIMRAPPKQVNQNYDFQRPIPVPVKVSSDIFNTGEIPHLQYYSNPISEPQYKLVPYEQTPPVQVPEFGSNDDYFVPYISNNKKPIPVPVSVSSGRNEEKHDLYKFTVSPQIEIVSNGVKTQNDYDYKLLKKYVFKKPYEITTDTGFKPIIPTTTAEPKYTYQTPKEVLTQSKPESFTTRKPQITHFKPHPSKISLTDDTPAPINYGPSSGDQFEQNNLAKILNSLQKSNSLPQTITADNIDSSIKALVQILNSLKESQKYIDSSSIRPILSTPVPFKTTPKPMSNAHANTAVPRPRLPPVKHVNIEKASVTPLPVHEYPPQDLDVGM